MNHRGEDRSSIVLAVLSISVLTAIYFFHHGVNLDISFSTGPNPIPTEPYCPQFNDALLIAASYL